ncbi:hypothetical protein MMC10_001496 [Thelotrema lepadinum]|nr:hypothetical protein [Thelotrema lepadinum]
MHSQQTLLILTALGLTYSATAFGYQTQNDLLYSRNADPLFDDDLFYDDLPVRDAYAEADPYAYAYAEPEPQPEPYMHSIARREAYIDALEQLLYSRNDPPPRDAIIGKMGGPLANIPWRGAYASNNVKGRDLPSGGFDGSPLPPGQLPSGMPSSPPSPTNNGKGPNGQSPKPFPKNKPAQWKDVAASFIPPGAPMFDKNGKPVDKTQLQGYGQVPGGPVPITTPHHPSCQPPEMCN